MTARDVLHWFFALLVSALTLALGWRSGQLLLAEHALAGAAQAAAIEATLPRATRGSIIAAMHRSLATGRQRDAADRAGVELIGLQINGRAWLEFGLPSLAEGDEVTVVVGQPTQAVVGGRLPRISAGHIVATASRRKPR